MINSPDHPITHVPWGDAARFANWLANGQPKGGEGPGTTEIGSYTLNGVTTDTALNAVMRNANATWVIPTETGSTSLVSGQNYLTDVGAYTASASPYGTFDQGGDVLQWNEALTSASSRGLRGGSWHGESTGLKSSDRESFDSAAEKGHDGFRVALVPEPCTAALAVVASGLIWPLRKRFKMPLRSSASQPLPAVAGQWASD
jgi:formylglycine-generating enzyme required for sulfatase activity